MFVSDKKDDHICRKIGIGIGNDAFIHRISVDTDRLDLLGMKHSVNVTA